MMCERKSKTCPRCNGKGLTGSHVAHLGVPGLCYQCDGSGVVYWITGEEVLAKEVRAKENHLKEIEERGNFCKLVMAEEMAKTEAKVAEGKPYRISYSYTRYEQDLESFRKLWREISKELKELATAKKKGKWVRIVEVPKA